MVHGAGVSHFPDQIISEGKPTPMTTITTTPITTSTTPPTSVLQGFYILGVWRMSELPSDPQAKEAFDYLWDRYLLRGTGSPTDAIINLDDTPGSSQQAVRQVRRTLAQRILTAIAGKTMGLTIPEIADATGYTEERVTTRAAVMKERGEIYENNGRYIAGAKPAARRGRPPNADAASNTNSAEQQRKVAQSRKAAKTKTPGEISVADATLKAVISMPEGANAAQILNRLKEEYGMTVRPNHLGIALQRHRRAGRIMDNNGKWSPSAAATATAAAPGQPQAAAA